jgi:transposase
MRSRKQAGGRSSKYQITLHKPNGLLSERVQKVGPQHFGIASIDCGKGRSDWMLVDFYGNVRVPAAEVQHTRLGFDLMVVQLRTAIEKHSLRDVVTVVERTGNYHLPVKRALQHAGFEVRIVHPFATKQFRQPADPGNKTDENDLAAIARAAINGFGLVESPRNSLYEQLYLLVRHRRDLVRKRASLYCQIREHLDAVLPGFASHFETLWKSNILLKLAAQYRTAQAMVAAGEKGLYAYLRKETLRFQKASVTRVLLWASNAAAAHESADTHQRVWQTLEEDRTAKTLQIDAVERDLAGLLARTPYVLLLSHPGINVVSAAELAGEMGPITNYASPKAITGRAGLYPSRYQSNQTDRKDGKMIRCCNRTLRATLLMVADNLLKCNDYYRALAKTWRAEGKDPRHSHVRVASRLARIIFQIVVGGKVFHHPSQCQRDYMLDKLLEFHWDRHTHVEIILRDLDAARQQIPMSEYANEAIPLQKRLDKTQRSRLHEPHPIGELLLVVLARLGVGTLQSTVSEDQGSS